MYVYSWYFKASEFEREYEITNNKINGVFAVDVYYCRCWLMLLLLLINDDVNEEVDGGDDNDS